MPPIPFLERTDRIIIQKRRWSSARLHLSIRGYHRMERDYAEYNRLYFRGELRRPTLDMDDGPARYLQWTATTSLFVPLELAERHPWRMVQETLLQQMIHQYLLQHQRLDQDPEHTRAFHRFCLQPRVRLALSMTCGLPGYSVGGLSVEEQRLYERVRRLLALGESPNPYEAQAALEQAQQLMLKYNIDLSLQTDPGLQRYGLRHLGRPVAVVKEADNLLASLLETNFFVRRLWVHSYDPRRDKEGHILEICGTRANLELACHVYAFLAAAAVRLWKQHRQREGQRTDRGRKDFVVGVLRGFRDKLRVQRKRHQVEGLVWLGDRGLDDFFAEMYPKTIPMKMAPLSKSTPALLAGYAAGALLELHQPIGDSVSGVGNSPTAAAPPLGP